MGRGGLHWLSRRFSRTRSVERIARHLYAFSRTGGLSKTSQSLWMCMLSWCPTLDGTPLRTDRLAKFRKSATRYQRLRSTERSKRLPKQKTQALHWKNERSSGRRGGTQTPKGLLRATE